MIKRNTLRSLLLSVCLLPLVFVPVFGGKAERITLKLWTYHANTVMANRLAWEAAAYAKSHPGITIDIRELHNSDLNPELLKGITMGVTPDIAILDSPDLPYFAARGALLDLTERVKTWGQSGKYLPMPWRTCIWQGRIYGIPQNSNTLCLFYNKDLFKKAGITNPPGRWTELVEDARKLTDRRRGVFGLTLSAIWTESCVFQWLPFLWQNGGDIHRLTGGEAAEALQLWVDLHKSGYVSREIINFTQADSIQQFASGKAAMAVNGSWQVPELRGRLKPAFQWGVALLPFSKTEASALGGEDWVIVNDRHAGVAWDYICWTQEKKRLEQHYIAGGRLPSRSDIAAESDYWRKDPIYAVFIEQLKTSRLRGPSPNWLQISQAIQIAMQQALTGEKSVKQALAAADAKIKPLLAQVVD